MPAALPHHRTGRPSMSDIPTVIGTVHEGMDELDFDSQPGPPSLAGPVTERKCRRHVWPNRLTDPQQTTVRCLRCNTETAITRIRTGRQSRNYGNRAELKAARVYGGEKIGAAGGPVDIRGAEWNVQ